MKVIIVGMGVQGNKRAIIARKDLVATVDIKKKANFKNIKDIKQNTYDTVILCVPDDQKLKLIDYCYRYKKNVLVEKPLVSKNIKDLENLKKKFKKNKLILYTAYNHRFEPHFIRMKKLINKKTLGKIYSCRMFYGNGTAKLVKNSKWRDTKSGVINDLGSHLLDTCLFWFGRKKIKDFKISSFSKFENNAPDHVSIISKNSNLLLQLEATLCMWKNHFTCDILAEKGSAHISSLCKWDVTKFILRKRKFPSGRPKEKIFSIKSQDPTWNLEYKFFKKICKNKKFDSLENDIWIQKKINNLYK